MTAIVSMVADGGPLNLMPSGGAAVFNAPATHAQGTLSFTPSGGISTTASFGSDLSAGLAKRWSVVDDGNTGDLWWIRCHVNSGFIGTGDTQEVWLTMASTVRAWGNNRLTPGITTGNVTIEFSTDGGASIVGGFTCDITASIT